MYGHGKSSICPRREGALGYELLRLLPPQLLWERWPWLVRLLQKAGCSGAQGVLRKQPEGAASAAEVEFHICEKDCRQRKHFFSPLFEQENCTEQS